jgi:hypothetical protein
MAYLLFSSKGQPFWMELLRSVLTLSGIFEENFNLENFPAFYPHLLRKCTKESKVHQHFYLLIHLDPHNWARNYLTPSWP